MQAYHHVLPFSNTPRRYFWLRERERERERYYTYPALRLIQVLPGHPLAGWIGRGTRTVPGAAAAQTHGTGAPPLLCLVSPVRLDRRVYIYISPLSNRCNGRDVMYLSIYQ